MVRTIVSTPELREYLNKFSQGPVGSYSNSAFLIKLSSATYKEAIMKEIMDEWSLSIISDYDDPVPAFRANNIENINDFKIWNEGGPLHYGRLICDVTYTLPTKKVMGSNNIVDFNGKNFHVSILSNPNINELIIDTIKIKLHVPELYSKKETTLFFNSGFREAYDKMIGEDIKKFDIRTVEQLDEYYRNNLKMLDVIKKLEINDSITLVRRTDDRLIWQLDYRFPEDKFQ